MKWLFISIFLCTFVYQPVESTTIYLVRHGQTDGNLKGRIQSVEDFPLNQEGREQARVLSDKLKGISFSSAYTSGLHRTKETAEILVGDRGVEIKTDKRFAERDYGHWRGRLEREYLSASKEEKGDVESDVAVTERVFKGLADAAVNCQSENILVVSHGGVLRNVITSLQGLPSSVVKPDNTGYVILSNQNGKWEIKEMHGIVTRQENPDL